MMKIKGPFRVHAVVPLVVGSEFATVCKAVNRSEARRIAKALNAMDDLNELRNLALGDVNVRIVGGKDAKRLHRLIYPAKRKPAKKGTRRS